MTGEKKDETLLKQQIVWKCILLSKYPHDISYN